MSKAILGAQGKRSKRSSRGFTLVELLVGGTIMLIVVLATLSLYMRSNKVAVDQNQYAELARRPFGDVLRHPGPPDGRSRTAR